MRLSTDMTIFLSKVSSLAYSVIRRYAMEYIITCLKYPDILNKLTDKAFSALDDNAVMAEGSPRSIAEMLSRAAVLYLPQYVVVSALGSDIEKDQMEYALSNALFDILSDTDQIEHTRSRIRSAYYSILSSGIRLDMFGAIMFMLPDILREWKAAALYHKEKLRSGENLSEILDFLSLYAQTIISDIPYVKILPMDGCYKLISLDGSDVDAMPPDLPEFEGMADEDILLSRLVNISPQKIDASGITDSQLRLLLERIFKERVIF